MYWKTVLDELNILFSVPPKCILEKDTSGDNPGGKWLPGAYLNPARNCLTNGFKRRLDDIVIRWRDEGSDDLPVNTMDINAKRRKMRGEVNYLMYARRRKIERFAYLSLISFLRGYREKPKLIEARTASG